MKDTETVIGAPDKLFDEISEIIYHAFPNPTVEELLDELNKVNPFRASYFAAVVSSNLIPSYQGKLHLLEAELIAEMAQRVADPEIGRFSIIERPDNTLRLPFKNESGRRSVIPSGIKSSARSPDRISRVP